MHCDGIQLDAPRIEREHVGTVVCHKVQRLTVDVELQHHPAKPNVRLPQLPRYLGGGESVDRATLAE